MKILFIDIETMAPQVYTWGLFNQNIGINQIIEDTYMLCWTAKWLGEDEIYTDALCYHPKTYRDNHRDDSVIVKSLADMVNQADMVVGHNGNRFDIPYLKGRMLKYGLPPLDPFRAYDTYVASRPFKLTSKKLAFLAQFLGIGAKIDPGGFDTWKEIDQNRCPKAFAHMIKYCEFDTELLEEVYLRLAPWDPKHPTRVTLEDPDIRKCNVCTSSNVRKNGTYATNTTVYQKYKCGACGHNMRNRFKNRDDVLLRSL